MGKLLSAIILSWALGATIVVGMVAMTHNSTGLWVLFGFCCAVYSFAFYPIMYKE